MKVVILAGGMGSRISEESQLRPKPMIEIGDKPILWHIMKIYASFGFCEFVVCCGYKGYMIKEYFTHYHMYQADNTFHLESRTNEIHNSNAEPWKITLLDTGLHTLTAGRILKAKKYIGDESFMLTYGDGVSDVNIIKLLEFHKNQGKFSTITTTRPAGRFGAIKINKDTNMVESFQEKARQDQAWVNAGFAVFEPQIFDYLGDGREMLERSPYENLAKENQMSAYKHNGFWAPMDTISDRAYLEKLWEDKTAPWKLWK